ncbi:MAG: glycerol-3-phosphate 1-O-acyltransferase PlsY [Mariprofundaceae bacterium]
MITLWLCVIGSYLLGAIPFGLLFARWLTGKDPRQHGSGNIGATNAMRTGGKLVGILTLLSDIAKGALPVAFAIYFDVSEMMIAIIAIAVFMGHIFPVYLKFKGGKGVATMFGILIPWMPWTAVGSFVIWLLIYKTTRYVSLASILAGCALPVLAWGLNASMEAVIAGACLGGFMIARHRSNILRLIAGEELKTGGDKK